MKVDRLRAGAEAGMLPETGAAMGAGSETGATMGAGSEMGTAMGMGSETWAYANGIAYTVIFLWMSYFIIIFRGIF